MSNTDFCELMSQIRGKRSYRQMENDTGINAAQICRMETGKIRPPKNIEKFYKKLMNSSAKPQKDVSLEVFTAACIKAQNPQLMSIMNTAKDAMPLIGLMPLFTMGPFTWPAALLCGGVLATKYKGNLDESNYKKFVENFEKKRGLFCKRVNRCILEKLAQKDITFRYEKSPDDIRVKGEYDMSLSFDSWTCSKGIIKHAYYDDELQKSEGSEIIKFMLNELIFYPYDQFTKITVVTNYEEAYKFILKYKNKLSYKGNLSIMLFDEENEQIIEETVISCVDCFKEEDIMYD